MVEQRMFEQRKQAVFTLLKDPYDGRDHASVESTDRTILPEEIDWTSKMSPVKNQGDLGSCVGFATVAMKEFQEQQEHVEEVVEGKPDHRKDSKYYDLSESWIYWMCKQLDNWPEQGTSLRYAMKVLHKIGVPVEKAWPYNDTIYGEPKRWAPLIARWNTIGSYYRVITLTELKSSLLSL